VAAVPGDVSPTPLKKKEKKGENMSMFGGKELAII
jgi:hypothetical protein